MPEYFIRLLAKLTPIPNKALDFWFAFIRMSAHLKVGVPAVLIDMLSYTFLRGIYNRLVFERNPDWIWPYWVQKQFNPHSQSYIGRGFSLASANVTHRRWTAIGTLHSDHELIVDPRGLITPFPESWSVDFWIMEHGRLFSLAQIDQVTQSKENGLPVLKTQFQDHGLVIDQSVFVDSNDIARVSYQVHNELSEERDCGLIVSVRPYNPDGISLIKHLNYSRKEQILYVNLYPAIQLDKAPDNIVMSDHDRGDVSIGLSDRPDTLVEHCPIGLCTGAFVYKGLISTRGTRQVKLKIALNPQGELKYGAEDSVNMREALEAEWIKVLEPLTSIKLNDHRLNLAFRNCLSHMINSIDSDGIKPGSFTYHHFWIRDAVLMGYALLKMGAVEEVKKTLEQCLKRQKLDGYISSMKGEWDGNGQVLWLAAQLYLHTRDKDNFLPYYKQLKNGQRWLLRKKRRWLKKSPGYNMLPPGISAEHFGPTDYYYWDTFFALGALRDIAECERQLGLESQYKRTLKHYLLWQKQIEDNIIHAGKKFKEPMVAVGPSRRMDSAAIGAVIGIYPLEIFSPYHEYFYGTLQYLLKNYYIRGGLFHSLNFSGFGPYLTCHLGQYLLKLRDQRVLEILRWLMKIGNETMSMPESVNPVTNEGCLGDGHHGWASAEYLLLVRNCLLLEDIDQDELVISPMLDKNWCEEGARIVLQKTLTRWGTINYEIVFGQGTAELKLDPNWLSPPSRIAWELPFAIHTISHGMIKDGRVIINPEVLNVKVKYEY